MVVETEMEIVEDRRRGVVIEAALEGGSWMGSGVVALSRSLSWFRSC